MSKYDVTKIRNIAIAGQNGSGKTALTEALLFKSGAIDRLGNAADGNTVCDYDNEEIKRKLSINTSLATFNYDDCEINLIDTPGMLDFIGGMYEGVYA